MFDEFESLSVHEKTEVVDGVESDVRRTIRLTNISVRKDDDQRVFQFLFDADFYGPPTRKTASITKTAV